MFSYSVFKGRLELGDLAVAKLKKIFSLSACLRSIVIDPIAFKPCVSTNTFAVEGHTFNSVELGELADKFLESALLAAAVMADILEIDSW